MSTIGGIPTFALGAADPSALTPDRADAATVPDQGDGTSTAGGANPESPAGGTGGGSSTQNGGAQGAGAQNGGTQGAGTQNTGAGQTTGGGTTAGGQNAMGALGGGGPGWAPGASLPGGGFPGQGLHRGHNPDSPPPGLQDNASADAWGKPGKGGDDGKGPGKPGRQDNQNATSNSTGRGLDDLGGLTKPLTTVVDQAGRIVSQLGSALLGNGKASPDATMRPSMDATSRTDSGTGPQRLGGNPPPAETARLPGESVPHGAASGRSDGAALSRGAEVAHPQAGTNGRTPGAQIAGGAAASSPQNAQLSGQQPTPGPQQAAAQQAALLRDGLQAAAAQALLGGLATQAAQQGAQAQNAAQQPPTPQMLDARAMPQGNPLAQASGPQTQPALQEKPQTLSQSQAQQQNAARGDKELRNPQQALDARQRQEAGSTDRALAKPAAEQQARTLVDARNAEAQARAKGLRDGVDAKRTGLAENARQAGENNPRRNELAGAERRQQAGGMASLRQALDWVGQQARGIGADARADEEGATTMRVVAGLVVAAVFVGVAIAVLYALRVAFVP